MGAYGEILRAAEDSVHAYAAGQIMDRESLHYGGVLTPQLLPEPKAAAFAMATAIAVYLNPGSALHRDPDCAGRIRLTCDYLERVRRPNGCFDLLSCNFGSAPDTCFMMLKLVLSWKLLARYGGPEDAWLKDRLLPLLERSAEGVMTGGFHTPNHRWAIASYLVTCARITGRREFEARAGQYLAEGIDCTADGEYSERSAGNYNFVNNDQMLRLYLETDKREYLDHAARNLRMMLCYFDPDGSVFTGNSRRQDLGRRVFPTGYYEQYLLAGHLTGSRELGAVAAWILSQCRRQGLVPDCLDWLMLFPGLEELAAGDPPPARLFDYTAHFPGSGLVRARRENHSFTLLEKNGRFLHFQSGVIHVSMRIGAGLCEHNAFIPERIEPVGDGFRMRFIARGWYYLPFTEKPPTSDWWAMDNAAREKIHGPDLSITVDVTRQPSGIDVRIATSGLDRLPLRVEIGVTPVGCAVHTPATITEATPGDALVVKEGMVTLSQGTDRMTIGPGFAEHAYISGKYGGEPRGAEEYTLYFTGFTPVERTIQIKSLA
jgi:hypothetical protein